MTKQELIDYCLNTFSFVYLDYPFDDNFALIRHNANHKTVAMIFHKDDQLYVNLKCDPMMTYILRSSFKGVIPGYHMNKTHWNSVFVNSDVPDFEIFNMIQQSYDLTKPKKRKNKMKYLFLEYPKCSTCKKAKAFLVENHIDFVDRHIVEKPPIAEELKEWVEKSGLPIKSFFNTSGLVYKELNLKDKLDTMSFEDKILLLCSNGMLIKRPMLVGEGVILTGFKEKEWETIKK